MMKLTKAPIRKGQAITEIFSYRFNLLQLQIDGCKFFLPKVKLVERGARRSTRA